MGSHDAVFGKLRDAKIINSFNERLGLGKHRVALTSYKVKASQKGHGNIIEADFAVLNSTAHKAGETKGWAWFPDAPGWSGAYEQSRAKEFLQAVAQCIGDTRPIDQVGNDLVDARQPARGLVIEVEITPQGGNKKNTKGEPYTNAVWKPITQTLKDMAKVREELDAFAKQQESATGAPVAAPPVEPAPTPQGGGLFGGMS